MRLKKSPRLESTEAPPPHPDTAPEVVAARQAVLAARKAVEAAQARCAALQHHRERGTPLEADRAGLAWPDAALALRRAEVHLEEARQAAQAARQRAIQHARPYVESQYRRALRALDLALAEAATANQAVWAVWEAAMAQGVVLEQLHWPGLMPETSIQQTYIALWRRRLVQDGWLSDDA